MPQMFIPGMGLAYQEWPAGGTPVVMLHDLGQNAHIWRLPGKEIAEAGHCAYALDLPAHGESGPCPWGYSLPALRPVLEGFRAGMGLARPVWVGWGASAKAVLDYAIHYPDQVSALILLQPVAPTVAPSWRRLPAYWALRRWLGRAGPFHTFGQALESGRQAEPYSSGWDAPLEGRPSPSRHPISHAYAAGLHQGADGLWRPRLTPEIYQRYMEAFLASDLSEQLSTVMVPVLIGSYRKNQATAQLVRVLPQARMLALRSPGEALVAPARLVALVKGIASPAEPQSVFMRG